MNLVTALIAGLVGVLVGGVVNVLADDLPHRRRPQWPHYADGAPRPPLAWLGVLAFLAGRRAAPGDASDDLPEDAERGARLPWRYPLVEVGLGIVYALVVWTYPLNLSTLFTLAYLAILMLITVIDLEHRLILFVVIIPASLLAILRSVVVFDLPPDLGEALLGGAIGFGVYFAIFFGGIGFSSLLAYARGEPIPETAFGFGDVMLGLFCGLLLGWRLFIFALILTTLIGAAGALLYMISRALLRGHYQMFTALPYGPYIVLGTVIMMFWGEQVIGLLLRR